MVVSIVNFSIVVVGIVVVSIVNFGIVVVSIVGSRCLSTISWLVTPGLHSAHVHCNHYHDDDDDDDGDGDDGGDGGAGGINRWS